MASGAPSGRHSGTHVMATAATGRPPLRLRRNRCYCSFLTHLQKPPAAAQRGLSTLWVLQMEKLTALFEEHGAGARWLDGCVEGFGGEYSRATIARELRLLGLKRGQASEGQVCCLRVQQCILKAAPAGSWSPDPHS